jgi:hypothetical protein
MRSVWHPFWITQKHTQYTIMYIHDSAEYQQALTILASLQDKGMSNLSREEKLQLHEIMRAVESYQFRNDPVSFLSTYA